MNGSPRHNPTARAILVAVALGAVVAGSASLASQLAANSHPISLPTGPNQIANAEELPAPGLVVDSSSAAPTTSGSPTTTAAPTTTTTGPATTSSAPPTSGNAPAPPATSNSPASSPAAPPSSPKPPSGPTSPAMAAQVFQMVNQVREESGCDSLREDSRLDNAAVGHSEDMSSNDYFSHNGPGQTPFDRRIKSYGYANPGGENIAEGQTSAKQVFNAWMSDSGHRDNILNCQFVAMGVGVDTQGWYWTQDFGY